MRQLAAAHGLVPRAGDFAADGLSLAAQPVGHAAALAVAEQARAQHSGRLVFAHIGRPTIRGIDPGQATPFGEFGADGASYTLTPANSSGK